VGVVTSPLELRPDGPHSNAYTVQIAWQVAEAVRVLNYATGSHAPAGLTAPATAYDVLGAMRTTALRMPQLFEQLAQFLEQQLEAGRLEDHVRHPAYAVESAVDALNDARSLTQTLEPALMRAQAAINGLYIPAGDADGEARDGGRDG
jgi:hypothetical protein